MSAGTNLLVVPASQPDRQSRDRLEILTALIDAPSFDPLFRAEVIDIPPGHSVYRWECVVTDCERPRSGGSDLCGEHLQQWAGERAREVGKAAFLTAATGLPRHVRVADMACRLCPDRSVAQSARMLCRAHDLKWFRHQQLIVGADFDAWLACQDALPGYGTCRVRVCVNRAESPLGLCARHGARYKRDDSPGGARLPRNWWQRYEKLGWTVPVTYTDEAAFRQWCATTAAPPFAGQINLRCLRPLVAAEIKWGLFIHTQRARPQRWDLGWLRSVVTTCRAADLDSLAGFDSDHDCPRVPAAIVREIQRELRLVYYTPADTRGAGFLETDHFGVRFPGRGSHFDLTSIPQRWLRDLAWDHLADLLGSPRCPRDGGCVDSLRRAAVERGAFLELDAPEGGHDPRLLDAEHMRRFVADQRRRERDRLPSLAVTRPDGSASTVTTTTRSIVFNTARKLLRTALDTGTADRIGLSRDFIVAIPTAGAATGRTPRRPFPDEVARALADPDNLARLAAVHDPFDRGLRDIWETTVITGRRVGEVIGAHFDCLGRYGGLPMFWHDQTKVGNYDAAIRIPERLYELLAQRQHKTMDAFIAEHGHRPTDPERARMALFPSARLNPDRSASLSYQWFHLRFKAWIDSLDLGRWVAHQARHTLATNLLRAGATLTHIRSYLGQVSDRMAEHYVHLSHSDLEDVLAHVWVTGPGAANPGEVLAGDTEPMTREQAQALAIDLSRRSTPAEGGFCTFQPVVDGGACPWNLDCHNCDKFVLSGADLLYWRRKREQWRQLAEGAPDDATADYLHQYFEPTARAIDGLEKALAGLGLLDQALALDLRKPQDYFQRVWATAFRAIDLAAAADSEDNNTAEDSGEAST
ncbi:MAG TPA: tyrosine-type recombinase/integrase [Pseudonocardiaceae bacterium]|nr:tyrosine-type recombinase/integrase [Pseudonocardiaceae bacterium]